MKDRAKLNLLDKIILWLNALLALSLILSYFAAYVNPKTIWELSFFGLAYPVLLTANLILVAWWLLRRKWLWLISIVCAFCARWNALSTAIGFRASSNGAIKPVDTNNVRVMTYNVHNFKRYGSNNDISTKHEILDIIRQEQPDVICFQEFYSRMRGQYDMRDSASFR